MTSLRSVHRDLRPIVRKALKEGWLLDMCGSGHLRLSSPEGAPVFASSSPSCWRARHKLRRDMRRAGADWL